MDYSPLCPHIRISFRCISIYILQKKKQYPRNKKISDYQGYLVCDTEFTIINFALWFDIKFRFEIMEVISAIGLSFIVLALLLKLPSRAIGAIGLVIIFTHNLLQGITYPANPSVQFLVNILFRPGMMQITPDFAFFTAYPLVPWLGIMLTGFSCGELFELSQEKRKKIFLWAGVSVLLLFILIRSINIYGDPSKFTEQKSVFFSVLKFFNVTKYPPSLLFSLLFIAIMFIILYLSELEENRFTEVLTVYGKVPLFYFIIHLFIIHSLMMGMLLIQGYAPREFLFGAFNNGRPKTGEGVDLWLIYLIWICVVVLLYPISKWYGNYKSAHQEIKFLKYL
jgi:uncharacterized membrane protein